MKISLGKLYNRVVVYFAHQLNICVAIDDLIKSKAKCFLCVKVQLVLDVPDISEGEVIIQCLPYKMLKLAVEVLISDNDLDMICLNL
jgi:hypothetical protein